MALRRIFVERFAGGVASIGGAKAHHYARAVRLRVGEPVELSDGEQVFAATVTAVSGSSIAFSVSEQVADAARPLPIIACIAVIKFARMEIAIEKAVELGVEAIVPVAAERSDPHLIASAAKRRERWERISEEAAEQSRRLRPAEIRSVAPLRAALTQVKTGWLADHGGEPVRKAVTGAMSAPFGVFVGPEGGWTDDEIALAVQGGVRRVALGQHVLRAETALTAMLAAAAAWWPG